ncbi:unnamed protein product [Ceutorhynchus assimilis]|uniref:Oxidoreductase-like domain-containing protein n=1 Tax=Ceutorhynchus assimilis TaxID=467358 RepID=A0A9N9QT60_9CUCU|nr:unnamed protein product [Ceutorhynchus assimilis]
MLPLVNYIQVCRYLNFSSWKRLDNKLKTALSKLYCTTSKHDNEQNPDTHGTKDVVLEAPEEPNTCCMSGCANCVWLEYAEKLTEYYKDGGEKSIREINEKITDSNIKAYLLHELRMRNK